MQKTILVRWRFCEIIHYYFLCVICESNIVLFVQEDIRSSYNLGLHAGFLQTKSIVRCFSFLQLHSVILHFNLGQPLTSQTIKVLQRHFLGNYSGRQHFFYLICYEMTSTVKPKVNHWLSLMTLKETGHVRKQLHFHFCCHRSFIAFDSNSTPRKELLTTSYFKF